MGVLTSVVIDLPESIAIVMDRIRRTEEEPAEAG